MVIYKGAYFQILLFHGSICLSIPHPVLITVALYHLEIMLYVLSNCITFCQNYLGSSKFFSFLPLFLMPLCGLWDFSSLCECSVTQSCPTLCDPLAWD